MESQSLDTVAFNPQVERMKIQAIWFKAMEVFGNGKGEGEQSLDKFATFGRLFEDIFERGAYEMKEDSAAKIVGSFKVYRELSVPHKYYFNYLRAQLAQYLVKAGILPNVQAFIDSPLERILLVSVFGRSDDFVEFEAARSDDSSIRLIAGSVQTGFSRIKGLGTPSY